MRFRSCDASDSAASPLLVGSNRILSRIIVSALFAADSLFKAHTLPSSYLFAPNGLRASPCDGPCRDSSSTVGRSSLETGVLSEGGGMISGDAGPPNGGRRLRL